MLMFLTITLLLIASLWLAVRVFLCGPDHSRFDQPVVPNVGGRSEPGPGTAELAARVDGMVARVQEVPRSRQVEVLRRLMDEGLFGAPVSPEELGVTVTPADAAGVRAEWVLAPNSDPDRRLLYIHGGGFYAGSPTSSRMLTAALGKRSGVSVLSIDYRLMPEHRRNASIADCQAAYRWLLDNRPDGTREARRLFVAGDSAGGNLTLMLSAWARDVGTRPADAVVAFSPSTDSTLSGTSFRKNIATDLLLGPALGPFARLPVTVKALLGWLLGRSNPSDPLVSPLFGDLGGLPPTLVQASDCEMLLDDARRYVNKARSAGSPVELQTWPGMVHVFQMYAHLLPDAEEALDEAAKFMCRHSESDSAAAIQQEREARAG